MNAPAAEATLEATGRRRLDYLELAKPRLNLLVLATTLAGFYVGSVGPVQPVGLAWTLLGTALVAVGASALNQWMERDLDGRMRRTAGRPLPARRLQPAEAFAFGSTAAVLGVLLLATAVNLLTAALAAATCAAYLIFYTPLKQITPWNTLVGAIPGAIPPVMGWAAARGGLGPGAAALFAILFLWQMPHFLAIAWLYRDEYERAGCRMLPAGGRGARRTGQAAALHAALLVPAALAPAFVGIAGPVYLAGAAVLGAGFLAAAVLLLVRCDDRSARVLFRASLLYLPLLFILMAADKVAS